MNKKIRSLDMFKKVPRDLAQGTNVGGFISILTTALICFFLVRELSLFLDPPTYTELAQDELFTRQQLTINLDITFPRLPCEIISLDIQDTMMSHHPNIGSVKKYRLNSMGKFVDRKDFEILRQSSQMKQLQIAQQAFKNQYGCRLIGDFTVKQVPGNFHISSHAYQNLYALLVMNGDIPTIDVSHTINYLYFGKYSDLKSLKEAHDETELSRLNGHSRIYDMSSTPHSYTSHYHLDIVPTSYHDLMGTEKYTYQYTWNHNTFQVQHMPSLYFNYHIGGIKVEYSPRRSPFFTFLLNLCAVIGGIYALASFLNNILHSFMAPAGYELVK